MVEEPPRGGRRAVDGIKAKCCCYPSKGQQAEAPEASATSLPITRESQRAMRSCVCVFILGVIEYLMCLN